MSQLGQLSILSATLNMPRFGSWRAEVVCAAAEAPAEGKATLTIEGLSLIGTIVQTGIDSPGRVRAVVVGGAGWDRLLVAGMSYRSSVGVRLSTVLRDLSRLSSEPIEQPADATMGNHFWVPAAAPGEPVRHGDVLASLVRKRLLAPWRVDPDGVTRFGARSGSAVTARASHFRSDAAAGVGYYGIDQPAEFLPGRIINGKTILRLVVHEAGHRRHAELWT